MRDSIKDSVLSTVHDLYNSGIVEEITLREIESLCIPEVKSLSPRGIAGLRKRCHLSQAAFAHFLNTSTSTIQKWEAGVKKPSGISLKLLNLADRKGVEGIT